ncbi:molybdopterin molybdotransferase MoeA [Shinella sp.]|uniref:molybdopterin molybdotransferase MoeA n=1 Tax=Shinella sp. TaxID=1870904 RepID=UPI003F6F099E
MKKQAPTSLRDALAFVASYVEAPLPPVRLALSAAFGHVLAEDIAAPVSLPRFDNAAMDGFAIRSEDIPPVGPASLKIAQTITAGRTAVHELQPGEAARIMTGAPLPPGADRVVVQEAAEIVGDAVFLNPQAGAKPHIRRVGEDVSRGALVLEAGTRIGPGQLALLTALGLRSVLVAPQPKVALLSTGDELLQSPGSLEAGQIYDTNRPMLSRMLQDAGAEVTDLGIAADDPETILKRLVDAAGNHDLLISSGGASVGFADHLTRIVSRRGYLEFWKLAMRPGKPIGFGDIDDCPMLLLPGNPLAAAAGFALMGRAIIARLEGRPAERPAWRLPAASPLSKRPGETRIFLGRLRSDPGRPTMVDPLPYEGSASLRTLALAEVMILLHPDEVEIGEGDLVEILSI